MIICFLLGGILLSEIARAYLILILAAGTFGLLSLACSSYFSRTSSALVVSYLVILPLAVTCVVLTQTKEVVLRDFVSIAVLPPWCLAIWAVVILLVNRRLLRPPDVGSEGKDVVDEEQEMKYAIGVVIDRDLFPDKLFAPAKRTDLMPDGTNPVLDKELRSEIFSQGTLMLRVVIQVSMLLSIPLMACSCSSSPRTPVLRLLCHHVQPPGRPGLLGREHHPGARAADAQPPADDAADAGQDRLRQAPGGAPGLDRPDLPAHRATLAGLLADPRTPRPRSGRSFVFLAIIATTCLATSTIGLLCSALSRKTSVAMVVTYMVLAGPLRRAGGSPEVPGRVRQHESRTRRSRR